LLEHLVLLKKSIQTCSSHYQSELQQVCPLKNICWQWQSKQSWHWMPAHFGVITIHAQATIGLTHTNHTLILPLLLIVTYIVNEFWIMLVSVRMKKLMTLQDFVWTLILQIYRTPYQLNWKLSNQH
jgi:hypothetical protein